MGRTSKKKNMEVARMNDCRGERCVEKKVYSLAQSWGMKEVRQ